MLPYKIMGYALKAGNPKPGLYGSCSQYKVTSYENYTTGFKN